MGKEVSLKSASSVVLLSLMSILNVAVADDDIKLTRPSLRGIKVVGVSVSVTESASAKGLIDKGVIQTDVELRLRKAGIRVISENDKINVINVLDSGAFISVGLGVIDVGQGLCAVHWDVKVEQATRLARDSSIIVPLAVTWSTGGTGVLNVVEATSMRV